MIVATTEELKIIYEEDQKDREGGPDNIDWEKLKISDEKRLAKVKELYSQGFIKTSEDMFYAAMIFQHGKTPENLKIAMELAKKSWKLGNSDGKWLYPRAEDRYLLSINKAQIWGTQYIREKSNEPWRLQEPFDKATKTEKERKEMGIDIEAKLKKLNYS